MLPTDQMKQWKSWQKCDTVNDPTTLTKIKIDPENDQCLVENKSSNLLCGMVYANLRGDILFYLWESHSLS